MPTPFTKQRNCATRPSHAPPEGINGVMIAMDGADLPASQAGVMPSALQITIGKTYDVLFAPTAGEYRIDATNASGKVLGTASITAN